ncbi:uncharacterized protein MYCFIDRAFT_179986 [Pseudocercospora fijiensis CIRAD86]|uniref:Uncharacterized protein n=1 Tax=Pseudocercospora fijiensis (strain CIRAD86) TaxID=383855 RepID=M2ZZ40_PSEFD|nr:uncharacterized protein MYCFIDRAFT_179986 [Pseudocercospora fijiensis CIRAD86]EME77416.1 hypothetical protein MYCFIDRAFT_179986 [Pseudocercospora fijiensis CIRAD86]
MAPDTVLQPFETWVVLWSMSARYDLPGRPRHTVSEQVTRQVASTNGIPSNENQRRLEILRDGLTRQCCCVLSRIDRESEYCCDDESVSLGFKAVLKVMHKDIVLHYAKTAECLEPVSTGHDPIFSQLPRGFVPWVAGPSLEKPSKVLCLGRGGRSRIGQGRQIVADVVTIDDASSRQPDTSGFQAVKVLHRGGSSWMAFEARGDCTGKLSELMVVRSRRPGNASTQDSTSAMLSSPNDREPDCRILLKQIDVGKNGRNVPASSLLKQAAAGQQQARLDLQHIREPPKLRTQAAKEPKERRQPETTKGPPCCRVDPRRKRFCECPSDKARKPPMGPVDRMAKDPCHNARSRLIPVVLVGVDELWHGALRGGPPGKQLPHLRNTEESAALCWRLRGSSIAQAESPHATPRHATPRQPGRGLGGHEPCQRGPSPRWDIDVARASTDDQVWAMPSIHPSQMRSHGQFTGESIRWVVDRAVPCRAVPYKWRQDPFQTTLRACYVAETVFSGTCNSLFGRPAVAGAVDGRDKRAIRRGEARRARRDTLNVINNHGQAHMTEGRKSLSILVWPGCGAGGSGSGAVSFQVWQQRSGRLEVWW